MEKANKGQCFIQSADRMGLALIEHEQRVRANGMILAVPVGEYTFSREDYHIKG